MTLKLRKEIRKKLEELGVDTKILQYIDQLSEDVQEGIYYYLSEILNDELLFIIALRDQEFSKEYLREKEREQPLAVN